MDTDLDKLLQEALTLIEQELSLDGVEAIRVNWLGKKGVLTTQMKDMAALSEADKPLLGKIINEAKDKITNALEAKVIVLKEKQLAYTLKRERLDVTMPGRVKAFGSRHPISLARERIQDFFAKAGFAIETGPEIEDDFHNFEALNIDKNHPARAMQDTFYVNENTVLRTHTSNVQIRCMETQKLPLRMIAPGRVYRSDSDVTHTPMFHQVEGMWIDENVGFSDLKGVLIAFLRDFFDNENLEVRFRPSYFPFTTPSAEVDIACHCGGKDSSCRICKATGWLEVLGSGMMHPNVLRNGGIDPDKYCGYAFGMGIERLAMLRYQVNDLRTFFENDIRFLNQFK